MFRTNRRLRALPLTLAMLLLAGAPPDAGDTQNHYVVEERPSLCLVTEQDGEFLRVSLMLRTEVPVIGVWTWLAFDHDELELRECAPGEMMHVSGCVVHLRAEDNKRGCRIEAAVGAGAEMRGRGEVVQLLFACEEKESRVRIRRVVFYGPNDQILLDETATAGNPSTTTDVEAGVESTSWASVKALYR
jgi:hypothetical protein